jgi:hypothetical protein
MSGFGRQLSADYGAARIGASTAVHCDKPLKPTLKTDRNRTTHITHDKGRYHG